MDARRHAVLFGLLCKGSNPLSDLVRTLEVLATVDHGDMISDHSTKLDHSENYLSRTIGNLVEKGLVYTERDDCRKRVVSSDARTVELYRDLVRQHSHIDFPDPLTGKALEVLCTYSKALSPRRTGSSEITHQAVDSI
jgi:DNA-binding MarR family transcriptional regulator